MGRVSAIEHANGEVNEYQYDALGNRSSIDFGSGGAVRYTHDPAGNIVEVVVTERDGEQKRQFVQIGDMNRVENITYEGMSALDIAYDAMGRAVRFDTGRDIIEVEYAGPDGSGGLFPSLRGRRGRRAMIGQSSRKLGKCWMLAGQYCRTMPLESPIPTTESQCLTGSALQ